VRIRASIDVCTGASAALADLGAGRFKGVISIMRNHGWILAALVVASAATVAVADSPRRAKADFHSMNGSNVTGTVSLMETQAGGTHIMIVARGLDPDSEYVSLYYENETCALEPYAQDDVIERFKPNRQGVARINVRSEERFEEIHSISVRSASTFDLRACASFAGKDSV
jgi:hypothetical protein